MRHVKPHIRKQDVDPSDVLYVYLWRKPFLSVFSHPQNEHRIKLLPDISGRRSKRRQRVIVLSLKDPPRDIKKGWVFGTNPDTADIVLDKVPGCDQKQFIIGFNHTSGVLILTDCSSSGTLYSPDPDKGFTPISLHNQTVVLKERAVINAGEHSLLIFSPQTEGNDIRYQKELVEKLGTAFTGTVSPITPSALHLDEELLPEFAIGKVIHRPKTSNYHVSVITEMSTGGKFIAKVFREGYDLDQEVEFLKRLQHDNIIQASEVVTSLTSTYVLMPCAKGSLFDFDCTRWDIEQKNVLATQLSSGLSYMHSLGIAHGDIKSPNILVFGLNPLHLKICDLGSATQKRSTTLKIGTLNYAAPEIRLKKAPDPDIYTDEYHTRPTDIWSLGLVLLECFDRAHRSCKSFRWGQHQRTLANKALSFVQRSDTISRLISRTIIIAPEARITATDCWKICQETGVEVKQPSEAQITSFPESVSNEPSKPISTYEIVTTTIQIQTTVPEIDNIARIYKFGQRQSFLHPPVEFSVTLQSTQLITMSTESRSEPLITFHSMTTEVASLHSIQSGKRNIRTR
ncbi:hypothetical protein TWF103_005847 [Orbilia oligospora]|nr:hypothetical protein TWF103_005847 [Orbilia oligospora]